MNVNLSGCRRRHLLLGLSIIAGLVTAAGCGKGSKGQADKILVGHYASLTGAEATFGISTDRGVILAMEERNAAGGVKGKKIALKTLDDNSKSAEAGNVVQRLISE
ncbi:MAG: ABC transporter substrate-binding protein, partial [Deltaproteobacteria bacterium]|nr:ABC transporter substrate-binding protein [Deltaproteobacteria bacterium]